jgi:hypothetical protein
MYCILRPLTSCRISIVSITTIEKSQHFEGVMALSSFSLKLEIEISSSSGTIVRFFYRQIFCNSHKIQVVVFIVTLTVLIDVFF